MNTREIEQCLANDEYTKFYFKGVYARDDFIALRQLHSNSMYICNMDTKMMPGSHWVGIYLTENWKLEYFDSYGLPPLFQDLERFLYKNCIVLELNDSLLQGFNSVVCGQYCIIFCTLRARGYSMKSISNFFTNYPAEVRDHAARDFVDMHFKSFIRKQLLIHKYRD